MTPDSTNDRSIEAGAFELQGLSGVAMACGGDAIGVRMGHPHPALGMFDGADILYSLHEAPLYTHDGSYSRTAWRVPITADGVKRYGSFPRTGINTPRVIEYEAGEAAGVVLEWWQDGSTVRGRYASDHPVTAALFFGGCFATAQVENGDATHGRLSQGGITLDLWLRGQVERPLILEGDDEAETAWFAGREEPGSQVCLYRVEIDAEAPLHFVMALSGDGLPPITPAPVDAASIDEHLAAVAVAHEERRMRSGGICHGGAEAVGSLNAYSRAYDPVRKRVMTTVNRTWGGAHQSGLIFGWDNFFDSYIAAWENPKLARASLDHIVSIYGESGIANGPVQRNLIIPILYSRTVDALDDDELTRRTWPVMMDFMRFWFQDRGDGRANRDGNGDGLIECGTSTNGRRMPQGHLIQEAMDETGYDDSPMYSAGFTDERRGQLAPGVDLDPVSGCLNLTMIGQNSMYVAACRAMSRIADRLAIHADSIWLDREADRVADRIRKRLYNEAEGIFLNRHWEGGFSPVRTMTIFYPLLAGIADDETKHRLREILLDPNQFWGDNMVPTVSRNDAAYCDGLDNRGNYWRGNCWAPTTYMTYLAIKEAGWHDIAAKLAERTCRQFLEYWDRHLHAYENFPPEGEVDHRFPYVTGWGGRELRYVWSAMNLFCGLEECFAAEYLRDGIRLGNPHLAQQTDWTGFLYQGQRLNASAGPVRTRLENPDAWEIQAEPGTLIDGFECDGTSMRFTVHGETDIQLTARMPGITETSGIHVNDVRVPGAAMRTSAILSVPPGSQRIAVDTE